MVEIFIGLVLFFTGMWVLKIVLEALDNRKRPDPNRDLYDRVTSHQTENKHDHRDYQ